MSKQYPLMTKNQKIYIEVLKDIKSYLHIDHRWNMTEIHQCFCILHKLTEYTKKST